LESLSNWNEECPSDRKGGLASAQRGFWGRTKAYRGQKSHGWASGAGGKTEEPDREGTALTQTRKRKTSTDRVREKLPGGAIILWRTRIPSRAQNRRRDREASDLHPRTGLLNSSGTDVNFGGKGKSGGFWDGQPEKVLSRRGKHLRKTELWPGTGLDIRKKQNTGGRGRKI